MGNIRTLLVYAVFLLLSFTTIAMGCRSTGWTDSKPLGVYLRSALWQDSSVHVCWEPSDRPDSQARNWVESQVTNQFNERTPLNFIGWTDRCEDANLRIRVADEGPHTKGLGNQLDGVNSAMTLNFSFENWSQSCKGNRKSCIQSIGVHEFGHASGLAHEQNRDDRPISCTDKPQGSNGDVKATSFDDASVMNYCNPVYNNAGILSDGDILTLQAAYGFQ